jgi:hypothetical protein
MHGKHTFRFLNPGIMILSIIRPLERRATAGWELRVPNSRRQSCRLIVSLENAFSIGPHECNYGLDFGRAIRVCKVQVLSVHRLRDAPRERYSAISVAFRAYLVRWQRLALGAPSPPAGNIGHGLRRRRNVGERDATGGAIWGKPAPRQPAGVVPRAIGLSFGNKSR